MKKLFFLTVFLGGIGSGLHAAGALVVNTSATVHLPTIIHNAFQPGEKFQFDIKYEFIRAGEASLEVTRGLIVNGRPTLGFASTARSSSFVDNFFKVRDFNVSQVDERSLASVNFHQNLREGRYRVIRNTAIDYPQGKYTYEKFYKGKTTKRDGVISQAVSDMLSAFFYARTLPLELGQEYSFSVFSDEDIYPMKVVVGPKLEKIKVEAGTFECLRVQPHLVGDAIFKASDGKMSIWMTNDQRKMPVLIRSKVAVGAFDAELRAYQPGKSDTPPSPAP